MNEHEWTGLRYLVNGFTGWLSGDTERARVWLDRLARDCGISAEFRRVQPVGMVDDCDDPHGDLESK